MQGKGEGNMAYKKEVWGKMEDGSPISLYTLTNENGVRASFTDLGGTWVTMEVPDREGQMQDVVLGYDTAEDYKENPPHLGSVIGRNANRIGGAAFTLNGKKYVLEANDGSNNLHSGPDLYRKRLWEALVEETDLGISISFFLVSPDKDQGYPGNGEITVTYTLTPDNSIQIDYHMVCDQDTVANFTNHSYFNLDGQDGGWAMDQSVWIDADFFTVADKNSIPTGEIASVKGTPMDFTEMKPIRRDLEADYQPLIFGKGYDHNWILNHPEGEVTLSAAAQSDKTGIRMEVYTDLPGMQFYTANFLSDGPKGKGGMVYQPRYAYCFETQYYPNAVNMPQFPSPVLKAGDEYRTTTIYKFSVV